MLQEFCQIQHILDNTVYLKLLIPKFVSNSELLFHSGSSPASAKSQPVVNQNYQPTEYVYNHAVFFPTFYLHLIFL